MIFKRVLVFVLVLLMALGSVSVFAGETQTGFYNYSLTTNNNIPVSNPWRDVQLDFLVATHNGNMYEPRGTHSSSASGSYYFPGAVSSISANAVLVGGKSNYIWSSTYCNWLITFVFQSGTSSFAYIRRVTVVYPPQGGKPYISEQADHAYPINQLLEWLNAHPQGTFQIYISGSSGSSISGIPYHVAFQVLMSVGGWVCAPWDSCSWYSIDGYTTQSDTILVTTFWDNCEYKIGDPEELNLRVASGSWVYYWILYDNLQGPYDVMARGRVYEDYSEGIFTWSLTPSEVQQYFPKNGWYLVYAKNNNNKRSQYVYLGIYSEDREGYNPDDYTPSGTAPEEGNWLTDLIDFFNQIWDWIVNFWDNLTNFFVDLFGPPDEAHLAYFQVMQEDISQRFPFCIVAWAAGTLGELSVLTETATAPVFTFSLMNSSFTIDLGEYSDWFFWIRTILRGVIWLMFAIWIIRVVVFENLWHIYPR